MEKQRRNYPGEKRKVGTKDYALILGNLIKYYNNLLRCSWPDDKNEIKDLLGKISIKLRELGYKKESTFVKSRLKNENNMPEKIQQTAGIAVKVWELAKSKHETAKQMKKRKGLKKKRTDNSTKKETKKED